MENHTSDFIVIGGGIGGLATALQLTRRNAGSSVTLLERADEFGEVGAGLQLAPNASRVLDELGLLERVARTAFCPERLVLRDAIGGEEITALRTDDHFTSRYGYPYLVAHRVDLHRSLLDACNEADNVTLVSGAAVAHITQDAGGVLAHCQDGRSFAGAVAIGADGIASTVRQQLINDGPPESTGYVAYRGVVPVDEVKRSTGVDELTDMVIWIGPGMHLVQYPVRGGQLCNQVAVVRSDKYRPDSNDWGTPAELEARFQLAAAPVRRSVALIDKSRRWEMFDREPCGGWVDGRIALLGDAAHPMFQYLAQGACQALEDAHVLGECVESAPSVEQALTQYEEQRFPRASTVQTRARMFGEILHAGGSLAAMRDYLLRRRSEFDYEPVDWLYLAGL
jgi:3-hydroxybenzoate 6-monooxygenase